MLTAMRLLDLWICLWPIANLWSRSFPARWYTNNMHTGMWGSGGSKEHVVMIWTCMQFWWFYQCTAGATFYLGAETYCHNSAPLWKKYIDHCGLHFQWFTHRTNTHTFIYDMWLWALEGDIPRSSSRCPDLQDWPTESTKKSQIQHHASHKLLLQTTGRFRR